MDDHFFTTVANLLQNGGSVATIIVVYFAVKIRESVVTYLSRIDQLLAELAKRQIEIERRQETSHGDQHSLRFR